MPMIPHATKGDYRDAFSGLFFPVSKVAVVQHARDQGGLDREVFGVVSQLPNRRYRSLEELQEAVRNVYIAHGADRDGLPL